MSTFAGSAIAQGPYVGRIDCWLQWRPTREEPLWLLLSGATDPPKEIGISKRRTRDAPGDRNGAFLAGVTRDLVNMEDVVGTKLFNTVKDLYLTKDAAVRHVTMVFEKCTQTKAHPMLYYTGHGEIGTGNWCFSDGTVSIQKIFDMVPAGCCYPMIFSDACMLQWPLGKFLSEGRYFRFPLHGSMCGVFNGSRYQRCVCFTCFINIKKETIKLY